MSQRDVIGRLQASLGVEQERVASAQALLAKETTAYDAQVKNLETSLATLKADLAREREAHEREAERRAELGESLNATKDRLAHSEAEATALREAERRTSAQAAALYVELKAERARCDAESKRAASAEAALREEEGLRREGAARVGTLEGVLRSLGKAVQA